MLLGVTPLNARKRKLETTTDKLKLNSKII